MSFQGEIIDELQTDYGIATVFIWQFPRLDTDVDLHAEDCPRLSSRRYYC
jgi:hypothetical protein